MEIEFVDVERLYTHERIVPSVLNRLIIKMEREKKFSVAIIVDRNTMTILDGHHRFEAAKRLGCKKVPCLLLDYNDPEIKLGQWFPVIYGDIGKIVEILEKNGMSVRYEKSLKKAYWLLYSEKADAILVPKRVTKEEVVKTAKRGELFPPKTTRHMLPRLNKFVDIPLEELV
ncbi:MAG: ParB N-terminal domain-containing protein [Candidatus Methanofastidiosa archaeon]|jgi:hypothetical protein|nr:ParB N-terminal domain-containing protein [Candidatus Methanofastidiosa archaeon]